MPGRTIGLDTRMIQHSGIGTYLRGLLEGFEKAGPPPGSEIYLYGGRSKRDSAANFKMRKFRSPIYSLQEQLEYPGRIRECDLWHAPHYNIPVLKGKTRLVVTVHDLIHWIFRKDFFSPLQTLYAKVMLEKAVSAADHIITVSEKTKEDLIGYFKAGPGKISVIYEAVSETFKPVTDPQMIRSVKRKYGLPEKFFLYVGMIKPHKNILWLVRLFSKLEQFSRVQSRLVIAGKADPKHAREFKTLSRLSPEGGILHIPFVETDDLPALYSGATALVHPSLYEGFGLTLLEAMACGTPVIAFRTSSIPEVTGDAAVLVPAGSEQAMEEALIRMETDSGRREYFRGLGLARVREFSWEKTAHQTKTVYEKVLG